MPGPHDRMIAEAAKAALGPLGFHRKGRSRTWLADHAWWLTIVEFQPSAWSKGAYLNVGAHWLWSSMGHLSFDFGHRIAGFVEYLSDAQFAPVAAEMGDRAARAADQLARTFASLNATADVLLADVHRTHNPGQGSWMAYNAGVAASLSGRVDDAAAMFGRILNEPTNDALHQSAASLAPLLGDATAFRAEVEDRIARQREALRLASVSRPAIPL